MEKAYIKVFTREPQTIGYPKGLAYSVHFACRIGDGEFQAWNKNYGILFAKGEISPENTIIPMALKHPQLAVPYCRIASKSVFVPKAYQADT